MADEEQPQGIVPSKNMLEIDASLRPEQALPRPAPEDKDALTKMYMSVQKTIFVNQAKEAQKNQIPVKTRNSEHPLNGPRAP